MMNFIIFLIVSSLVFYLLLNNVEAISSEPILGGEEAPEHKFLYQVSIQKDGVHVCGGGILDDTLVAAVAHCFLNKTEARFYDKHYKVVSTKEVLYVNEEIASADVKEVYFLKTFDMSTLSTKAIFNLEEEFVIVKLKEGLGLGRNPLLKKLKTSKAFSLRFSSTLMIAGYGVYALIYYSTFTIKANDGKLRYAETDIVSNSDCSLVYNTTIKNSHLCARVKQITGRIRGACMGDSGGPLVQNDEIIIGVLVCGSSACSESVHPGIYLRISYYSTFIENAKRGDTSDMRVFSLIKTMDSEYTFVEDKVN